MKKVEEIKRKDKMFYLKQILNKHIQDSIKYFRTERSVKTFPARLRL